MAEQDLGTLKYKFRGDLQPLEQDFKQVKSKYEAIKRDLDRNPILLKCKFDDSSLQDAERKISSVIDRLNNKIGSLKPLKITVDSQQAEQKISDIERRLSRLTGINLNVPVLGSRTNGTAGSSSAQYIHPNLVSTMPMAGAMVAAPIGQEEKSWAGIAKRAVTESIPHVSASIGGATVGHAIGGGLAGEIIGGGGGAMLAAGAIEVAKRRYGQAKPKSFIAAEHDSAVPVELMDGAHCPKCGARNAAGATYCRKCGYDFRGHPAWRAAKDVGKVAGAAVKLPYQAASLGIRAGKAAYRGYSAVSNFVQHPLQSIGDWLFPTPPATLTDIHDRLGAMHVGMHGVGRDISSTLGDHYQALGTRMGGHFGEQNSVMGSHFSDLGQSLGGHFGGLGEAVGTHVSGLGTKIGDHFGEQTQAMGVRFNGLGDKLDTHFGGLGSALGTHVGSLNDSLSGITDAMGTHAGSLAEQLAKQHAEQLKALAKLRRKRRKPPGGGGGGGGSGADVFRFQATDEDNLYPTLPGGGRGATVGQTSTATATATETSTRIGYMESMDQPVSTGLQKSLEHRRSEAAKKASEFLATNPETATTLAIAHGVTEKSITPEEGLDQIMDMPATGEYIQNRLKLGKKKQTGYRRPRLPSTSERNYDEREATFDAEAASTSEYDQFDRLPKRFGKSRHDLSAALNAGRVDYADPGSYGMASDALHAKLAKGDFSDASMAGKSIGAKLREIGSAIGDAGGKIKDGISKFLSGLFGHEGGGEGGGGGPSGIGEGGEEGKGQRISRRPMSALLKKVGNVSPTTAGLATVAMFLGNELAGDLQDRSRFQFQQKLADRYGTHSEQMQAREQEAQHDLEKHNHGWRYWTGWGNTVAQKRKHEISQLREQMQDIRHGDIRLGLAEQESGTETATKVALDVNDPFQQQRDTIAGNDKQRKYATIKTVRELREQNFGEREIRIRKTRMEGENKALTAAEEYQQQQNSQFSANMSSIQSYGATMGAVYAEKHDVEGGIRNQFATQRQLLERSKNKQFDLNSTDRTTRMAAYDALEEARRSIDQQEHAALGLRKEEVDHQTGQLGRAASSAYLGATGQHYQQQFHDLETQRQAEVFANRDNPNAANKINGRYALQNIGIQMQTAFSQQIMNQENDASMMTLQGNHFGANIQNIRAQRNTEIGLNGGTANPFAGQIRRRYDLQEAEAAKQEGRRRFMQGEDTGHIQGSTESLNLRLGHKYLQADLHDIQEDAQRQLHGLDPEQFEGGKTGKAYQDRRKAIQDNAAARLKLAAENRFQGSAETVSSTITTGFREGISGNLGALPDVAKAEKNVRDDKTDLSDAKSAALPGDETEKQLDQAVSLLQKIADNTAKAFGAQP